MVAILFILTLLVYSISHRGEGAHLTYFVPLADAFLHGRLYIIDHPSWLDELIFWNNHYYVVLPPMPAILLMPFVAIFGNNFYQPIFSIWIGSISVPLCYVVLLKIFNNVKVAFWSCILYGFGSMLWYHAEVGSGWYLALVLVQFFLWMMILEVITKKRFFVIGLLISFAYLTRLPTILSVAFVLVYLYKELKIKSLFWLGIGLLLGILTNWIYNYLRFGTISDIAYNILLKNSPSHPYGLLNIRYIPVHIWEIFTAMPVFVSHFPYVIPSLNVMAIWLVMPALFLIMFAQFRQKIVIASVIAIFFCALPSLLKGGNGFTQFGYRYALDYMPFLIILCASGLRNRVNWFSKILICLSILINLWGVLMIGFFHLWRI